MSRYFVHDLESNKLHIFTGGKADWLSLPEVDRESIKSACLWSRFRNCWVSRALAPKARIYLGDILKRLGFEDRGTDGEKLTFAEQIEAKQERAEARAERAEDRAEAAGKEWASEHRAADAISSFIPFGQPILVGHHSEKRHRRDLAKIDAHLGKAVDAAKRKEHYEQRAATARATAEGKQYSDRGFLGRRIKELEASERLLKRRLEGKFYEYSTPEPISDEYREQLTSALEDVEDKLGFYRHCLETCEGTGFDRETLKGKEFVKVKGRWERVVRLNPTTVSVYNTCFSDEESQRRWPLKYLYAEVQDAR